MKLKQYIKHLQEIEKKHGGDLKVIYSGDDEGNYYDEIVYSPGVGNFDHVDNYIPEDHFEDDEKINAVCIN